VKLATPPRTSLRSIRATLIRKQKVRTYIPLVEKVRIMAVLPQFLHPQSKQRTKKSLARSTGWLWPAESLEFVPRDELKKLKLARQGCQPVTAD
jgi:hypothetical protein